MDGRITLVTGVSGFVGSVVARALVGRGRVVRGIARAGSLRANLRDFPGDLVEGDLRDPGAVARAMAGVGQVFHVAADYRLWARDPQQIIENNREMTRVVMRAAMEAGVARVVYTSSVATLLPLAGGVSDETRPAQVHEAVGAYKKSKVVAERLVEAMVGEGLPAVIVNPSTPIGPGDVRPTPTGRILVECARGRMPAFVDTGLNLVHVDDVAMGHVLAGERGAIGRRYVLGGQDVRLGQMLGEICGLVGRAPPRVRLPVGPLVPLAWGAEIWGRLSGVEPFVTRDALKMARQVMFYSSARAQGELGYCARPYAQALADAVAWFRGAGMIAP
jgi:dihydroflavonol-4-reductase